MLRKIKAFFHTSQRLKALEIENAVMYERFLTLVQQDASLMSLITAQAEHLKQSRVELVRLQRMIGSPSRVVSQQMEREAESDEQHVYVRVPITHLGRH